MNLEIGSNEILDFANRVKLRLRLVIWLHRRNEKDIAIGKANSSCPTPKLDDVESEEGSGEAPDRVCHLPKLGYVSHVVARHRVAGGEGQGAILAESANHE